MPSLELIPSNTNYNQSSTTRPIEYSKGGGTIYFCKPLTAGNSKLGRNILIFDLLAIDSCLNCSSCATTCYAMKAQRQYPDVWNKRAIYTYLAKHDLKKLEHLIDAQLFKVRGNKYIRIHSSGDFVSQDYINMWNRIVTKFPNHTFYYYTKVNHIFDFTKLNTLPNCNMVHSILPDKSKNYGSIEYITEKQEKYPQAKICQYGIQADIKCGENCTLCMHNKYILFKQH